MKIGILTLPFNNNYGGYLQAYALMTVLKKMGHDVELIYRRPKRRPLKYRILNPIKTVIKILLGMPHCGFIMNQETDLRRDGKLLMPFVDKNIVPRTKPFYTTASMKKSCAGKYDTIIVGSDQVWRPKYLPNIYDFFLEFVEDKNVKKIAYAASFGTSTPEYTEEQKLKCGHLISSFSAISVRENSGLDVIRSFGWKTNSIPQLVLDPTFLLERDKYFEYLLLDESNNIFCYILDKDEKNTELIKLAEQILHTSSFEIMKDSMSKSFCQPSIETWLSCIYNSKFVLTDSFHGMVFSIIFNKPFAVCVNHNRGADRFRSLLFQLNLESRIINSKKELETIINKSICWNEVNKKLQAMRLASLHFLTESLKFK